MTRFIVVRAKSNFDGKDMGEVLINLDDVVSIEPESSGSLVYVRDRKHPAFTHIADQTYSHIEVVDQFGDLVDLILEGGCK